MSSSSSAPNVSSVMDLVNDSLEHLSELEGWHKLVFMHQHVFTRAGNKQRGFRKDVPARWPRKAKMSSVASLLIVDHVFLRTRGSWESVKKSGGRYETETQFWKPQLRQKSRQNVNSEKCCGQAMLEGSLKSKLQSRTFWKFITLNFYFISIIFREVSRWSHRKFAEF